MFIQTESTPNPATLKFIPGEPVLPNTTADFADEDAATKSVLATKLFGIAGITRVFYGHDFISVTKSDNVEWNHIKPAILGAIMEQFQSNHPLIVRTTQETEDTDEDNPNGHIIRQIKELLDTRVRPAVAQDGGDIIFHGFEKGVVYLHMQGACAGCPSSTITLKMGIENLLRHFIPEVVEVRPVV